MRVLFLRKRECAHSDKAERYLRLLFDEVFAESGSSLDSDLALIEYDALFAFRSHIIVRKNLLDKVRIALNFHPGPPERPGIGCVNFAIAEGDSTYGATCHYITEEVDAGPIVSVSRFPIHATDSVESLLGRTYDYLLCQFYNAASAIADGQAPESCGEQWARKATRKKDLESLREIPADCDDPDRLIRATSFPGYPPFVTAHGRRWYLSSPE
jgi:methionyl-tRNA formyltransferase